MIIQIENDGTTLRDRILSDIDDFVRWYTGNPEWKLWNAPWKQTAAPEELKVKMLASLGKPLPVPRKSLEICQATGEHIGWVSSYRMKEDKNNLCVGLTIAESQYWGKGIGTTALKAWLTYLFSNISAASIYCETWSGNTRVIRLAEKCGFIESERFRGTIEVSAKKYDGLTFRLERTIFNEFNKLMISVKQ